MTPIQYNVGCRSVGNMRRSGKEDEEKEEDVRL